MRLLDEADDLKLLRRGESHGRSPPSPIMLFLSSRNSSACSATTSFKSCASRLSCLTSSVVAAPTVSPASRRLPAWQGVYFLEFGTEGGPHLSVSPLGDVLSTRHVIT